jgi:formylglycine-generating enzyme required for sulfatase activity
MPEEPRSADSRPEPIAVQPVPFRSGRRRAGGWMRPAAARLGIRAAGALLLALGAGAWFVLTAQQVSIHLDPAPDSLSLSGGWMTPRIGGHYLLRPGTYTLKATLACHGDLVQRFEVGADDRAEIRLTFQRLPGRLRLQALREGGLQEAIQGAEVFIDGRLAGAAPLEPLEVSPGRRRIEIRSERYLPAAAEVDVEGCDRLQELTLALAPNWSGVAVSSIPAGAAVKVDGRPLGKTPVELELAAGSHEIEISADRHKTWRERIEVKAGQPVTLPEVRLVPADGRLAIRSRPAGASVLVSGRYVGLTPLEVEVAAGKEHEIQLSKTGYESASRKAAVASGETKGLELVLAPQEGVVLFTVEPADAELLVDGTSLGKVPAELTLSAVEHAIEIRKEGHDPFRTRILPRPGLPQQVKATLKRRDAAPAAGASAAVIRAKNGYEMKRVAPGTFAMGSSRREQGRRSNEVLKQVRLSRPFYMGTREVTNREFREFMPSHTSGAFKNQDLNRDDLPAVMVSWEQAALFCNWLSVKESLPPVYVQREGRVVAADPLGKGYRLPTEAEWEFSVRQGLSAKYPWGEAYPPPSGAGNYADESARGLIDVTIEGYNDGYAAAASPGRFKPGATGLFDLGGNVAEWCHDYYAIDPSEPEKEQVDPAGPTEGAHRVVKGASWKMAGITYLRAAFRDYSAGARHDLGFRVCRYAE